jgi:hypothetical protein
VLILRVYLLLTFILKPLKQDKFIFALDFKLLKPFNENVLSIIYLFYFPFLSIGQYVKAVPTYLKFVSNIQDTLKEMGLKAISLP